jgi:hypothetical protein
MLQRTAPGEGALQSARTIRAFVSKAPESVNPFLQEPVRQRKKTVVWFVLFIWLNQTNQTDQINQRDLARLSGYLTACLISRWPISGILKKRNIDRGTENRHCFAS